MPSLLGLRPIPITPAPSAPQEKGCGENNRYSKRHHRSVIHYSLVGIGWRVGCRRRSLSSAGSQLLALHFPASLGLE